MFKLKYEDVLDFTKWNRLLFWGAFVCVCLVMATEIVILTIYQILYGPHVEFIFWVTNVIVPAILYTVLLGTLYVLVRYYNNKGEPGKLPYANLLVITCIVFVVVNAHYVNSSIYVAFLFPILAALAYIDIKPLIFAFLLNLFGYLFFCTVLLPGRESEALANQGPVEITTTAVAIGVGFIISLAMLQVLTGLVENIIHQNEELKLDPFTKLLNHTAFYDHLTRMVEQHQEGQLPVALIIWDIDDFKQVNDRYGHGVGDRVISIFSDVLRENIPVGGHAFRYGGEEFAALLVADETAAQQLATQVRTAFTQQVGTLPIGSPLSASAGICGYNPVHFNDIQKYFSAADIALYRAKATPGKNTSCVWDLEIDGLVPARRRGDRLRAAQ